MTAPEIECAPISAAFSISTTSPGIGSPWPVFSTSALCRSIRFLRWIAVAMPEGPPPTITTSNSITSRSVMIWMRRLQNFAELRQNEKSRCE